MANLRPYKTPAYCSYCQTKLLPDIYFCPNCAQPYKDIETVISPEVTVYKSEETLVKEKAPGAYNVFWIYFGLILCMGIFSLAFEDNFDKALMVQGIIFASVTVVLAVIYSDYFKPQLFEIGFNHIEAYIGLLLLVPCLFLNYGISEFYQMISNVDAEGFEFNAGAVIFICVFPGIFEEIGFRGILFNQLHTAVSTQKALVISSFLFALLHFNILTLPYLFLLGYLLGWVCLKTQSLYPSMLIHFLHNFVVIKYL